MGKFTAIVFILVPLVSLAVQKEISLSAGESRVIEDTKVTCQESKPDYFCQADCRCTNCGTFAQPFDKTLYGYGGGGNLAAAFGELERYCQSKCSAADYCQGYNVLVRNTEQQAYPTDENVCRRE